MINKDKSLSGDLLPETLKMMEEFGIGSTRDKWKLDSIPVGGYKLIKVSEMPSKEWTGPTASEIQKAAGLSVSVRKTNNPDFPIAVIRTS